LKLKENERPAVNLVRMRARTPFAAAAAAALVLAAPGPAHAAVAAAVPGSFAAGFATPVVVAARGEGITFANTDVAPHNFIADGVYLSKKDAKKSKWCSAYSSKTCPLFWSPTISSGESTEVQGL
jgi:plastocyanin